MKWNPPEQSDLEARCAWIIDHLVRRHVKGLPPPEREYQPLPDRKYRLDLAWHYVPDTEYARIRVQVGIEVQGGIWQRGASGHKRAGQVRDMHKLNALQIGGWLVLQFSPDMLRKNPQGVADVIVSALRARGC